MMDLDNIFFKDNRVAQHELNVERDSRFNYPPSPMSKYVYIQYATSTFTTRSTVFLFDNMRHLEEKIADIETKLSNAFEPNVLGCCFAPTMLASLSKYKADCQYIPTIHCSKMVTMCLKHVRMDEFEWKIKCDFSMI